MEVKIDDYGRIVIPKEVRELLGIESGASLDIRVIRKGAPKERSCSGLRERSLCFNKKATF